MNNKCDKIKREKVEDMKPSACRYCPLTSKRRYKICIHVERKHERAFSYPYCIYESKDSSNMQRHIYTIHSEKQRLVKGVIPTPLHQIHPAYQLGKGYDMQGVFDVRLKENFKLFISGPSRCGKTVFVSKLLENIHTFAKLRPTNVCIFSSSFETTSSLKSIANLFTVEISLYELFMYIIL